MLDMLKTWSLSIGKFSGIAIPPEFDQDPPVIAGEMAVDSEPGWLASPSVWSRLIIQLRPRCQCADYVTFAQFLGI